MWKKVAVLFDNCIFLEKKYLIIFHFFVHCLVSSLMRGSSSANNQMSGLAGTAGSGGVVGGVCSAAEKSAAMGTMQFPMQQRRKRRVLFTQAQVRKQIIILT